MSAKSVFLFIVLLLNQFPLAPEEAYILSPRDTAPPPGVNDFRLRIDTEYLLVYESENLKFYFRDDRDVFAIEDKRNNYIWKTGLDIPFNKELDELVENEGIGPLSLREEVRLNTTYTGIANSLVSIEYFDSANNIKRSASAANDDVQSEFTILSHGPFEAQLRIDFQNAKVAIIAGIRIKNEELIITIADRDVTGTGLDMLANISIAQFFGAGGGRQKLWDPEEEDWTIEVAKPTPIGYAVVPDGCGALVRFLDNSTKLSGYIGDVYGDDLSQSFIYRSYDDFSVPPKNNFIPLFGIVHGNMQNAVAGYATSGAEYMQIVSLPEENTTYYTIVYPRFVYNNLYYQVYNKRGDGYFKTLDERNHFNLEMHYSFLAGSGGTGTYPADYTGIARKYRDYLNSAGQFPDFQASPGDIPLRLDFLMADVKDSIIGYTHEITTTIEQVDQILNDLQGAGIGNMSVGLLGYAKGGTVLNKPEELNLMRALGPNSDFKVVLADLRREGVDVSFGRDYARIGAGQITPWGNAIKGASGQYNERRTFQANAPVNLFYYTRAEKLLKWVGKEAKKMVSLGATSHTVDGMGYLLFSDYSGGNNLSVTDTIQLYQNAFADFVEDLEYNFIQPNQYLWKYTRRFLQIPLFSTQLLIETDTIPLLQMILQGQMDLFAPYSNFSFYGNRDILRMIDYNVYPSFLLTAESAHLLLMTNSAEYYSTEYRLYRELILKVYATINNALKHARNTVWVGREVLIDGVILNTYDNGIKILINYTQSDYHFEGTRVGPVSAKVIFGE